MTMNKIVIICLGAAAAILAARWIFAIGWSSIFTFAALAACPLLHVLMMKHGGHEGHHEKQPEK